MHIRKNRKECPICNRMITLSNFRKHVEGHERREARRQAHKASLIRPVNTGKASTPEKEILRRQRISETMKKNPKSGGLRKGSGRGKKCWYKSPIAGWVYLRSTYELAYCRYLDKNKIQWKQNTEGFLYEFEGKKHFYYPDFIVEGKYVEIKGFKRKNDEAKWKSFPHELQILYYNDLQKLGIDVKGNFTEHIGG